MTYKDNIKYQVIDVNKFYKTVINRYYKKIDKNINQMIDLKNLYK